PTPPAPEQPGEDAPSEEHPDAPIVRTPDTQPQTRWGVTTPEDILSGESPLGADEARGCNASGGGTAGVPITAAVGLLSFAALFARRRKPAQARAHSKR
ncbi:MYXO-CTERM sorting domain-containing protein, partial [Myxococcus xanthus]